MTRTHYPHHHHTLSLLLLLVLLFLLQSPERSTAELDAPCLSLFGDTLVRCDCGQSRSRPFPTGVPSLQALPSPLPPNITALQISHCLELRRLEQPVRPSDGQAVVYPALTGMMFDTLGLTDIAPGFFGSFPNLQILTLRFMVGLELSPQWFAPPLAQLSQLRVLTLTNNGFNSLPVDTFRHLPSLLTLSLHHNNFSHIPVALLAHNRNLTELDLENNPLTNIDTQLLQPVGATLEMLDIGRTALTTLPPDLFVHTRQLGKLTLGTTKEAREAYATMLPTNDTLTALSTLRSLYYLNIEGLPDFGAILSTPFGNRQQARLKRIFARTTPVPASSVNIFDPDALVHELQMATMGIHGDVPWALDVAANFDKLTLRQNSITSLVGSFQGEGVQNRVRRHPRLNKIQCPNSSGCHVILARKAKADKPGDHANTQADRPGHVYASAARSETSGYGREAGHGVAVHSGRGRAGQHRLHLLGGLCGRRHILRSNVRRRP